jgi:hypothetical protein
MFGSVLESYGHFLQPSGLPRDEVGDARVSSWRDYSWCLCLATTLSHMGGEVDRLAYPLHRPMAHCCLLRGQSLPVR